MISASDYKTVSDSLGQAQVEGQGMYESMGDMMTHLDSNDVTETNVDKRELLKSIYNEYQFILLNHVYLNERMYQTVQALQNHIEKHYGPVNDFLSNTGTKVSQDFADLSEMCGFVIDPGNIE
jgi:hypothetical protein